MAITTPQNRILYSGTGSTTILPFPYLFEENSDIQVEVYTIATKTPVLLALNTDYTATGAGVGSGGTVTLIVAPPVGTIIMLQRIMPLTQTSEYDPNSSIPTDQLNTDLDRLVMITQQLTDGLNRAITGSIFDPLGTSLALPAAAARAGMLLGFDTLGNVSLSTDIGQIRGNWVTGTAYNYRDIVTDGSNGNLYVVTVAYTSGVSLAADVTAGDLLLVLNVASVTASATAAAASATAAATSATGAAGSATTATTQAGVATTQATNAAGSATTAGGSATAAAGSATSAAGSASAANTSALAAAASAATIQPFDTNQYAVGTGTNTFVASLSPAPTSYATGMEVAIELANANTAASTLNLNGLGAKGIQKNGSALAGGEIAAGTTAIFRYDGTNFQLQNPSSVAGSTGFSNIVALTSGTSWTIPAGVTKIKYSVIGGGGSGAGSSAGNVGVGGGSGAVATGYLTGLTPGNTIAYAIGAAGAGTSGAGANGGATTFNTTISAGGGVGAPAYSPSIQTGPAGGSASGGTINLPGQKGQTGGGANASYGAGAGGDTPLGWGQGGRPQGASANNGTVGDPGNGYGAGGAGATGLANGGSGTTGAVIIEW
jgi:hypothetical protein